MRAISPRPGPGLEVSPSPGFGAAFVRFRLGAFLCACFILSFRRAFVRWWSCPVLGFLLVSRSDTGYTGYNIYIYVHTLLCSFAGCRCSAPASGAAALAGLLRFVSVYARLVRSLVPASEVLSTCLAPSVCLAPATRRVWHAHRAWSALLAASVPYIMCWVSQSVFFILGYPRFWACFCLLVAPSRTWLPADRIYTLLLLCWLPLFRARSRRCGSCRPPEVRWLQYASLAKPYPAYNPLFKWKVNYNTHGPFSFRNPTNPHIHSE